MRLFRGPVFIKKVAAKGISGTARRFIFEDHPHFHQHNYPFLPVHFINESKHNNLALNKLEEIFTRIQITKKNNAAETARLFKQLTDIKESEKELVKTHHDAFKAVFYEFTQHWLVIGEKLQSSRLFEKFERLHDDLEEALIQNPFNKNKLEMALSQIEYFIKKTCSDEKANLDDAWTMSVSCLKLLLKNLNAYSPNPVMQEYKPETPGNISCKL